MKAAHPDTWMPLYVGDYLADTMHLSTEEDGAYFRLIMHYWKNGGAIENDQKTLKNITGISSKKLTNVLRFFEEKDGFLYHKRIDEELAKAREKQEKKRNQTEGARKAKQEKTKSVTDFVTDVHAETPSPSQKTKRKTKGSPWQGSLVAPGQESMEQLYKTQTFLGIFSQGV